VAWTAVVAALGFLIAANIYCVIAFADPANPPMPSLADVAYLAEYPLVFLALGLLVRSRALGFRRSLWIDGAVATLGNAGLWTALDNPNADQAATALGTLTLHAYGGGQLRLTPVIGLLWSVSVATVTVAAWAPAKHPCRAIAGWRVQTPPWHSR
jgi:hypothetical protein